ncbi:glycoside hydrolase family 3 protein [Mycetocola sp. JXN-3]|uniref:glycoside hydrolase family 3 protein n=1 Tax=Mycetocola sp. JXN-3 TaxID=2116510 RepID=UPI00165CF00F|nr:glycoside hydrolase family 3 C-terminal domain-containing protein [Mycetocola sp. JXN-3]
MTENTPVTGAPAPAFTTPEVESALETKLAALPLEVKVALITGGDFWSTLAVPEIGLASMVLSDGPAGVRGAAWDERDPSLNLPSGTALAATWDTALAHTYGEVLAAEARRKGVDVVLGPTINMQRTPRGGRHFEAFSEDPLLSGEMAIGYTEGLQGQGIAAVPKHYVANDSEDERFHVNVRVDEKTLREVYYAPFEAVVTRGEAWGIMSAYNQVNGTTMSESPLLEAPLATEWGFDGLVISDWTAVRTTVAAARSRQDLAMPGPTGPWGEKLIAAIAAGEVAESDVDAKVLRLLRLAWRVGALADVEAPVRAERPGHDPIAFARSSAAAAMVLVRNEGAELPWSRLPGSVAVIGEAATLPRTQGGGSAFVVADHVVTPLDGIASALPNADLSVEPGVAVTRGLVPFPLHDVVNPETGEPGVHVRFLDADGGEVLVEERRSAHLVWTGGVPAGAVTLEATTLFRPQRSGSVELGVETIGSVEVFADGERLIDGRLSSLDDAMGTGLLAPPRLSERIEVRVGTDIQVRVVNDLKSRGHLSNAASISFGLVASDADDDGRIRDAVAAATAAEVAVVFVGTTNRDESEGKDRKTLSLPGRQDELVAAVAAANPRTIVVVNAGSPVLMPWRRDVSAILLTWFPGQEFGDALADVLTGAAEPGGRLPTTWPATEEDVPVLSTTPTEGVLTYTEGIHIGYRAWNAAGRVPAFPFGYGLGYTTFERVSAEVRAGTEEVPATVIARVRNSGERAGKHVLQAYLTRLETEAERPERWLVAFAAVEVQPGAETEVRLDLPLRAFRHWNEGWEVEPGEYRVLLGDSAASSREVGTVLIANEVSL